MIPPTSPHHNEEQLEQAAPVTNSSTSPDDSGLSPTRGFLTGDGESQGPQLEQWGRKYGIRVSDNTAATAEQALDELKALIAQASRTAVVEAQLQELKYLDEIFAEYDSKREVWSVIQAHIRNRRAQLSTEATK